MDICPTGVFTDKTARFKARYWDYDLAPSVCPHCSLGCNTVPAARYRELLKTMARRNDAVNGWFICDRGRFENQAVNDPRRPRQPLVDGKMAGWDEALDTLGQRLRGSGAAYEPETLAIVGSSRLAMEAASLLHHLAAATGAGSLCYFALDREAAQTAMAATHLNGTTAASMADVQAADVIGIVNCRLLEDGPMMALAVRQAWRRGAKVFLVGDDGAQQEQTDLPFAWQPAPALSDIPFGEAKKPVLICGSAGKGLADLGQALAPRIKLACLLGGPNGLGAALLAREHGATSLAGAVAAGKVKGIIAVEADIPLDLLQGMAVVAALDWRDTPTVKAAGIVLPTTAWVEMDGTYINNEGRAQRFKKVMTAGLPITGLDPAGHPPRQHGALVPGGLPRPAWEVVAALVERLGTAGVVLPLAGSWQGLRELDAKGGGQRIWPNPSERQVT